MTFPQTVGAIGLAIFLAISCVPEPAHAAAIELTQIDFEYDGTPWTLGWRFTVNSPSLVESLGVYDSGQDGLAAAAQVGLWLATGGTPLVQTMIAAGTAAALEDHFRFAPVAPTVLTPGTDYIVGAYLNGELATALFGGNGVVDPRVTIVDARYSPTGSGFAFPGLTDPGAEGSAFLGGNIRLAPVPLPAAAWLFGSGVVGVIGWIRRNRITHATH